MIELPLSADLWGLPGAAVAPVFADADGFTAQPVITLLAQAAGRDGRATALIDAAGRLTYAELLDAATKVASSVAARVPPGGSVATLLPQSVAGVVGLLGCLISGRLCIILNPGHPAARLAELLAGAVPDVLLTIDAPPFACELPTLTLAAALAPAAISPPETFAAAWDPDSPFVVQFTSGSTGRPKGIVRSARTIMLRVLEFNRDFDFGPADRFLDPASMLPQRVLYPIAVGAAHVLTGLASDGVSGVLRLMQREAVTAGCFSTTIMTLLQARDSAAAAFRTMRIVRCGGGTTAADLASWRAKLPADCVWASHYASTEGPTLGRWQIPKGYVCTEPMVPAGELSPDVDYALIDEDGGRAAPGAAGELVVRGRHVALGEWRDGRLATDRFPASPDRPGWRELRTGDIVRVGADGMLRVLGRADRMVKINGVRVEPAEIECVLRGEPGVTDAAVVATAADGATSLHGFVAAPLDDVDRRIASLRRRLADSLPSQLCPARLTVLERLPALPNGKPDLQTLGGLARSAIVRQPG